MSQDSFSSVGNLSSDEINQQVPEMETDLMDFNPLQERNFDIEYDVLTAQPLKY